jgi:hypothetical protein
MTIFPSLQLYEAFKAHALARTNLGDKEALGKMVDCAIKIKPDDALSKSISSDISALLGLPHATECDPTPLSHCIAQVSSEHSLRH